MVKTNDLSEKREFIMKRVVSIFMTVLLIAAMLSVFTVQVNAESYYASLNGSGTESDPYKIKDSGDWEAFVSAIESDPNHGGDLYFKLTGDIGSEGNEVWSNINEFHGVFDGDGKTIWYSNNGSLFYSNYGEIKNIVIRSGEDLEWYMGGGVICFDNYGTIDHCVNYVSLIDACLSVGGIVGDNDGLIINCVNYGFISSLWGETGGICGENSNTGCIINCLNTAAVSGSGICGYDFWEGRIEICFNCGKPSSGYAITQFIKDNTDNPQVLKDCYFLIPNDGAEYAASNHKINNRDVFSAIISDFNLKRVIGYVNQTIEKYNNQTGRELSKWKLDDDGIPTFAEVPTGTTLSNGNWWIIVVGAVVIVGGIVTIIVFKKKKATSESIAKSKDEE